MPGAGPGRAGQHHDLRRHPHGHLRPRHDRQGHVPLPVTSPSRHVPSRPVIRPRPVTSRHVPSYVPVTSRHVPVTSPSRHVTSRHTYPSRHVTHPNASPSRSASVEGRDGCAPAVTFLPASAVISLLPRRRSLPSCRACGHVPPVAHGRAAIASAAARAPRSARRNTRRNKAQRGATGRNGTQLDDRKA